MKFETIRGVQIPKIGFGTWKIGGERTANLDLDEKSNAALHSAIELGYTFFDTAESYAANHCEDLLGEVIHEYGVQREKLFITSKVSPDHLEYEAVLEACEGSLRRLRTEYLDLYLIHWPNPKTKLEETFRALNKLVRDGKVKHVGVSNFNLRLLKKSCALSETPLLTNQVPYNLPNRKYAANGVLEFCQRSDILITAYSPIKFRNLNVNLTLKSIAEAHHATPAQIAIAWLIAQPRVITIPMSFTPQHQKENFDAADIELSEQEIQSLNKLYSR